MKKLLRFCGLLAAFIGHFTSAVFRAFAALAFAAWMILMALVVVRCVASIARVKYRYFRSVKNPTVTHYKNN